MNPTLLKTQAERLNRFLTTLYKWEMRFSLLLAELGFSEAEIALLREPHLAALVAGSTSPLTLNRDENAATKTP